MLSIKLKTGEVIEDITTLREIVLIENGVMELNITLESNINLTELYEKISKEGALDSMLLSDSDGIASDLLLTGYNKLISIEKIFNSTQGLYADNFKTSIRIHK